MFYARKLVPKRPRVVLGMIWERYYLFCTAAVCAESCDVAYLSIVSVTAKLTPMKARKPRAKRMNEPVMFPTD